MRKCSINRQFGIRKECSGHRGLKYAVISDHYTLDIAFAIIIFLMHVSY